MAQFFSPNDCRICKQGGWIEVIALRICDGDIHYWAGYCRDCALELLYQSDMGVTVNPQIIGTTLDECYRSGCDRCDPGCVPSRPFLCEACKKPRLADVWITYVPVGSEMDLDKGTSLCVQCAVRGFRETGLPERLRKEFMNAIFPEDLCQTTHNDLETCPPRTPRPPPF